VNPRSRSTGAAATLAALVLAAAAAGAPAQVAPDGHGLGAVPVAAVPDGVAMPIGAGQDAWLTMGSEFVGLSSGFVPFRNGFAAELGCAAGSSEHRAIGRLALPDGVAISRVVVWRFDASDLANLNYSLWQHCLPPQGPDTLAPALVVGQTLATAPPGYARSSQTLGGHFVDALQCSYYIEVNFGQGCPAGGDLRLLGVQVSWFRP
jgi:hypothetical protein